MWLNRGGAGFPFGADALRSGQIVLKETPIGLRSPKEAVEAGLALVPEDRKTQGLFLDQSICSNITLSSLNQLTRFGGDIQRCRETVDGVERARRELSIAMALPELEAQHRSGGNQQKVVLGETRQTSPSVIIFFDQPTRGVDVMLKLAPINELMRELAERGVAILMISVGSLRNPRHERPDPGHARAPDRRRARPRRGQRGTDHRACRPPAARPRADRRERDCVVPLRRGASRVPAWLSRTPRFSSSTA